MNDTGKSAFELNSSIGPTGPAAHAGLRPMTEVESDLMTQVLDLRAQVSRLAATIARVRELALHPVQIVGRPQANRPCRHPQRNPRRTGGPMSNPGWNHVEE